VVAVVDDLIAFLRMNFVIGHDYASGDRLADLAAKRLIVDECENVGRYSEPAPGTVILADKVLRLLALPLADAHGYNEDWKP
jgi:hypothetical protein